MKGFVPTPPELVDRMVAQLFAGAPPRPDNVLLDPGCGTGAFIEGVLRWGRATGSPVPSILGVESNPALLAQARERIGSAPGVALVEADFLTYCGGPFDYIIGNPPYVPITGLSEVERATYRRHFQTATGRFDLYSLFFEQALTLLSPRGRLVFVTPEKFTYVESALRLRQLMAEMGVQQIEFISETTFEGLVTYPVITTVDRCAPRNGTHVTSRSGESLSVTLPSSGQSWLPHFSRAAVEETPYTAAQAFTRISCGVATGADEIFVLKTDQVPESLRPFAHATISGRQLSGGLEVAPSHSILVPYSNDGELLPEGELGALADYLGTPETRARLMRRVCVARKPWYAFHENPPLVDILRPKILCKDIIAHPRFVVDASGDIVPRHSVYYLVPSDPERVQDLCDYLNSVPVSEYLEAHCQRAANGYYRLQSHVLKRIPFPEELVPGDQLACA